MMLASLNLLAFAWHTMLELLEPPWIPRRGGRGSALRQVERQHVTTMIAIDREPP